MFRSMFVMNRFCREVRPGQSRGRAAGHPKMARVSQIGLQVLRIGEIHHGDDVGNHCNEAILETRFRSGLETMRGRS
jgi:hypothetical protein